MELCAEDFRKEAYFTFSWCAVGCSGDAEKQGCTSPWKQYPATALLREAGPGSGRRDLGGLGSQRGMGTYAQIQATPVTTLQPSDP